jgi:hypothetical protein
MIAASAWEIIVAPGVPSSATTPIEVDTREATRARRRDDPAGEELRHIRQRACIAAQQLLEVRAGEDQQAAGPRTTDGCGTRLVEKQCDLAQAFTGTESCDDFVVAAAPYGELARDDDDELIAGVTRMPQHFILRVLAFGASFRDRRDLIAFEARKERK